MESCYFCFLSCVPSLKCIYSLTRKTLYIRLLTVNIYGYERVKIGDKAGSYTHENFVRGKPEMCGFMFRTKIKDRGKKKGLQRYMSPRTASFKRSAVNDKLELRGDNQTTSLLTENLYDIGPDHFNTGVAGQLEANDEFPSNSTSCIGNSPYLLPLDGNNKSDANFLNVNNMNYRLTTNTPVPLFHDQGNFVSRNLNAQRELPLSQQHHYVFKPIQQQQHFVRNLQRQPMQQIQQPQNFCEFSRSQCPQRQVDVELDLDTIFEDTSDDRISSSMNHYRNWPSESNELAVAQTNSIEFEDVFEDVLENFVISPVPLWENSWRKQREM